MGIDAVSAERGDNRRQSDISHPCEKGEYGVERCLKDRHHVVHVIDPVSLLIDCCKHCDEILL